MSCFINCFANFNCHTRTKQCFLAKWNVLLFLDIKTNYINYQGCSSRSHCSQIHVILIATTAYVVCLVGIILMYIWYAPEPSCLLNIFFITWTLVLLQFMTSVSLHPKVSFDHQRASVHSYSNLI